MRKTIEKRNIFRFFTVHMSENVITVTKLIKACYVAHHNNFISKSFKDLRSLLEIRFDVKIERIVLEKQL